MCYIIGRQNMLGIKLVELINMRLNSIQCQIRRLSLVFLLNYVKLKSRLCLTDQFVGFMHFSTSGINGNQRQ